MFCFRLGVSAGVTREADKHYNGNQQKDSANNNKNEKMKSPLAHAAPLLAHSLEGAQEAQVLPEPVACADPAASLLHQPLHHGKPVLGEANAVYRGEMR